MTALGVIESVPTNGRSVALTFDDGPSQYTAQILDILREAEALATFFVRGGALVDSETEELVRREFRTGHDVANHTHSHHDLDLCDDAVLFDELVRTHADLEHLVGRAPDLVRPPYGHALDRIDTAAAELGYTATVSWSIHAEDWLRPPAKTIVDRVLSSDALGPGAIIVLHDGASREESDRQQTVDAVRALIPALRSRDLEPTSVSRLLAVATNTR